MSLDDLVYESSSSFNYRKIGVSIKIVPFGDWHSKLLTFVLSSLSEEQNFNISTYISSVMLIVRIIRIRTSVDNACVVHHLCTRGFLYSSFSLHQYQLVRTWGKTSLIPIYIPTIYLPYTSPKSVLSLISVPGWYNLKKKANSTTRLVSKNLKVTIPVPPAGIKIRHLLFIDT